MVAVHNPDSYMFDFRQIIALGRKRIGLLIGAGASADLRVNRETGALDAEGNSLIPTVEVLTGNVLSGLSERYRPAISAIVERFDRPNIEDILSMSRRLADVLGQNMADGLSGPGYQEMSEAICQSIDDVVNVSLPYEPNAFTELIGWIGGVDRAHAIEIFTTNYDLLFEQAMERLRLPYFDGFVGASEPFFNSSTVANNDLPVRWARLWKLHGSIGWTANDEGQVIRKYGSAAHYMIYPEHMKYDRIQKAPYTALFYRLQAFLMTPDTLLVVSGFSFADAHVSARIDDALAANPAASVFAFQYGKLDQETHAAALGRRRANFSVFARDGAIANCVEAPWHPGQIPSKEWEPIRGSYWGDDSSDHSAFLLGRFSALARFFAFSRSDQLLPAILASRVEVRD